MKLGQMADRRRPLIALAPTLLAASGVSVVLYAAGAAFNGGAEFYYLLWNLFLAWLPLVFAYFLIRILRTELWSSWPVLGLTVLWLVFLPNSFYLISDFLHIYDAAGANATYNVAMFASFAFNGLLLGYFSLWVVHRQLLGRGHGRVLSWSLISLVLLISSYAIYLGRYVRLNSWDVFTNFSAVLFSITDQFLNPSDYPAVIGITLSYFLLLATIYLVLWRLMRLTNILKSNED